MLLSVFLLCLVSIPSCQADVFQDIGNFFKGIGTWVSDIFNAQNWECGSGGASELASHVFTKVSCPGLTDLFNNACKVHDQCYESNMSQENCDDTFCAGLKNISARLEGDCGLADAFCDAVKKFGHLAKNEVQQWVVKQDK